MKLVKARGIATVADATSSGKNVSRQLNHYFLKYFWQVPKAGQARSQRLIWDTVYTCTRST